MKLEKKIPEPFWEYAARWAIYILNRTPNRFDGEWPTIADSEFHSVKHMC